MSDWALVASSPELSNDEDDDSLPCDVPIEESPPLERSVAHANQAIDTDLFDDGLVECCDLDFDLHAYAEPVRTRRGRPRKALRLESGYGEIEAVVAGPEVKSLAASSS
eukprot:2771449-Amphidinium_carterae.1